MITEGHVSIQTWLLGIGVISYAYFMAGCSEPTYLSTYSHKLDKLYILLYCATFYVTINLIIGIFYQKKYWPVAFRACFLGAVLGGAIISCFEMPTCRPFGYYISALSLFHFSEYLITAITNPSNLKIDSFLLSHSVAYWAAAISSWVEFFIELWLFPQLKSFWYISVIGVVICILGEITRKSAMITANANFNHIVQTEKRQDHQLVTWGIYKYFRHPSYVGWFWWSLGTQLILINPFCLVIYTIVSWKFFHERIHFEEMTLIKFFGVQYLHYKTKVSTGLPFIDGYKINEYKSEMNNDLDR